MQQRPVPCAVEGPSWHVRAAAPLDCSRPALGASVTTVGVAAAPAGGGAVAYAPTGLHRLSRIEYDNTLADLLRRQVASRLRGCPKDVNDPFDNDFTTQTGSGALIEAAETLADVPRPG